MKKKKKKKKKIRRDDEVLKDSIIKLTLNVKK
jgi:hypothetical protein